MAVKITDNTGKLQKIPNTAETNARIKSLAVLKNDIRVSYTKMEDDTAGNVKTNPQQVLTGIGVVDVTDSKATIRGYASDIIEGHDLHTDLTLETAGEIDLTASQTGLHIDGSKLVPKESIRISQAKINVEGGGTKTNPRQVLTGIAVTSVENNEANVRGWGSDVTDGTELFSDLQIKTLGEITLEENGSKLEIDGSKLIPKESIRISQATVKKEGGGTKTNPRQVLTGIGVTSVANDKADIRGWGSDVTDGTELYSDLSIQGLGGLEIKRDASGNLELDASTLFKREDVRESGTIPGKREILTGVVPTPVGSDTVKITSYGFDSVTPSTFYEDDFSITVADGVELEFDPASPGVVIKATDLSDRLTALEGSAARLNEENVFLEKNTFEDDVTFESETIFEVEPRLKTGKTTPIWPDPNSTDTGHKSPNEFATESQVHDVATQVQAAMATHAATAASAAAAALTQAQIAADKATEVNDALNAENKKITALSTFLGLNIDPSGLYTISGNTNGRVLQDLFDGFDDDPSSFNPTLGSGTEERIFVPVYSQATNSVSFRWVKLRGKAN